MEIGGGTEGTAQPSVVYGTYDESGTKWTQNTGLTADGVPYENSATGANVRYSKTATPVEGQKDTYKITLKIESETSSTAPGASAVVLVIDNSGSMADFNRLKNAKEVAKEFVDDYGNSGEERYIALVGFAKHAYKYNFGKWWSQEKVYWLDASNSNNRNAIKKSIDEMYAYNGTNLQDGLLTAADLLKEGTAKGIAKDNKFAIALTDGQPTYYTNDEGWVKGDGSSCDQDTYNATKKAATTLKADLHYLYTVCYGAQDETIQYSGETVSAFLQNYIASSGMAHVASDDSESLKEAFEEIYKSIEQGLSSGFTVTDPMGEFIQLDKSSIKDATAKVNGNTITWTPTTGVVSEENGVKTYTYTLTYTVKLDTSDKDFVDNKYYPTNGVTTLAFRDGDENITRNFNVPGVKGESPKCTVTYNKGNHGNLADQDDKGNVATSVKLGSNTPAAPAVTPDDGYEFTGWNPTIAETVTEDVTYTAQYKIKDDLSYTVHYYWNGTNDKVAEDKTVDSQTFNETVTETPVPVNGYTPVSADSKTITIGTDTNANVITFYYYKNVELKANGDTVTYDGKVHSVSGFTGAPEGADFSAIKVGATGTEAGTYPANFADNTVGTVDATGKYIVTKTTNGNLTINPIGTVTVTIKGNTDSKVYNGTEQSVTGYDVEISDPKYTRDDFKFTGNDKVYRTDVGTTYMGLKAEQFENKNSNFDKVTFVIENDGYVEVTKRTVTLTSETASKTYDGTPLTKPEVTVTGDGFVPGEVTDIKATGSVTNVSEGSVTNTIVYTTTDKFVEDNYNITKDEGTLTINPRSVIITSGSASKTYDGTPLTNDEIKITGDGFVDGEATAIATGSQTEVGSSDNTIEIIKKDGFDANNYAIELKEGTLTVEKRPYIPPVNPPITDKITVEITGNSDSVVYDGTEHSVKDYTVKISDSRYTEKDFTFSGKALASGINAGAYEMGLKADQFKNTNARFTNVEFIIKADGVLTITQRPLTITAGSAEGIAPVTCDKYTVEGLATGDKVDSVKITGIQSEPGESPNVASDAVIKNAKGEDVTANYKITYVNGVLKAIEVLNKEIHFNYVIGYTDGTIRPNNDISRAEVATIFFRLLTDEAREQYTTTAGNFTDVKAGMWCNRAIATLTNMGIIKGYTDGSFQPNKSITRAELATIIARFAKLDVNTKTFSDINGHWAQKNIELAAGNGWINGYEDGTFRPNNNITRAETFAMINRVLDRQTESVSDLLPTSEMNMWSDNLNENAWYYKDVQEATNYHKCDRVGDSVYEKWTEKVPDIDWASYQI